MEGFASYFILKKVYRFSHLNPQVSEIMNRTISLIAISVAIMLFLSGIASADTLGTWTTANSLTAAMSGGSCVVNNNNIYCALGNGNTVETAPITITPLSNVAIAPSSPIIDSGQNIAFTGSWSNGQTPYNALLYSGSSASCASDIGPAGAVQTNNGIVFYTTSFSPVSPTASAYYCVKVTDGSSATANSVATLVTVDTAPTGSAIVPAANTLDIGQNVIISTTLSNGRGTVHSKPRLFRKRNGG